MKNIAIMLGMALLFAGIGLFLGPMVAAARDHDDRPADRRVAGRTRQADRAMVGFHGLLGVTVGLVVGAGLGALLAQQLEKGKKPVRAILVPPPPPSPLVPPPPPPAT